jgi:murein DD-endopeptidase MepM/ murein hydrolase activator NlpD
MFRLALILALAATLLAAPAAHAYQWPVEPFHQQHPIRGYFGDPRTIYFDPFDPNRFPENGDVSFHNGVDIMARPGTAVYPVLSGVVRRVYGDRVVVQVADGRRFQYVHIHPATHRGEHVRVGRTVLGRVTALAAHVHLTEISPAGHPIDPLLEGHLRPYSDTTVPHVRAIEFRTLGGLPANPYDLKRDVFAVADAFDEPAMALPPPWDGVPIAPAFVRWSLEKSSGRVIRKGTTVDFRAHLPLNSRFWDVYARGTYQNHPQFAARIYPTMPGRYYFRLVDLNTETLADGVYVIHVTAGDTRGNIGTGRQIIGVCNRDPAPCERLASQHGR